MLAVGERIVLDPAPLQHVVELTGDDAGGGRPVGIAAQEQVILAHHGWISPPYRLPGRHRLARGIGDPGTRLAIADGDQQTGRVIRVLNVIVPQGIQLRHGRAHEAVDHEHDQIVEFLGDGPLCQPSGSLA